MEKVVVVPPEIKYLNFRVDADSYNSGTVWYDDLKIERLDFSQNEIVSETNYYPFGLEHKGYNNQKNTNNIGEDWRFNGMEHQNDLGLNTYDFGARNYDPALGRWMNVDLLADITLQPYSAFNNNPINMIDPTGMFSWDWREEPWDWVQRADGNIKWDENVTSADDVDLKEGEKYLGKAVVVFDGSTNEKLGTDGTLTGEGANSAKVTVYGPKGADDIKTYDGLSVSSDPSKYSMIEAGDYEGRWQQMATSPYGKGSLTYRIHNLDGSTRINPVGGINKANGKSYMEGIFLHRTNWSGKATHSSQGCLNVCGSQWKGLENQLGKMPSFRIRVTR